MTINTLITPLSIFCENENPEKGHQCANLHKASTVTTQIPCYLENIELNELGNHK